MRWVLLSLVALVVGFALGRSDIGRNEFERSERSSDPRVSANQASADRGPRASSRPTQLGSPSKPNAVAYDMVAPADKAPTEGFEDMGDQGELISDGPETISVYIVDLDGTRSEQEIDEDGSALAPGIYDVWWIKSGVRIGRKVRVEAGKVTRVNPADGGAPFVPDGLSVVSARVLRANGEPASGLSISFDTIHEGLSLPIESDGGVSQLVRPGRVKVSVGDFHQNVRLEPGEQRVLDFPHARHGDLIFNPKPSKKIAALLRIREVYFRDVARKDLWQSNKAAGFLFADPGEYEVFLKRGYGAAGGRVIGRAVISAGRETRFELNPPTGALAIDITLAASVQLTSALMVSLRGGPTGESEVDKVDAKKLSRTEYRATFPALFPGRYRVKCLEEVLEVSVGKGEVRVAMRVE